MLRIFWLHQPSILDPRQRERLGKPLPDSWWQRCHDGSLAAYALLAFGLEECFAPEKLPEMERGEKGKPFFPERPGWQFSLSHTENAVVLAISDAPVGVDAERRREAPARLSALFARQGEEDFWSAWTGREALGKLRGCGIGPLFRERPALLPNEGLYPLPAPRGYTAWAAAAAGEQVQWQEVTLQELLCTQRKLEK